MTGLPVRAIVVLTFDLPNPEAAVDVLKAIDPPRLPHFAGDARVAVDPEASAVLEWLDAEEAPRTCRSCGCTEDDCSGCIERTGTPCHWVEADLCSACEYAPDPVWEYGFRMDGRPEVWSRVFGLPITSVASARHSAEKSYRESYEVVRHPKGSTRDDDWEMVPTGDGSSSNTERSEQ